MLKNVFSISEKAKESTVPCGNGLGVLQAKVCHVFTAELGFNSLAIRMITRIFITGQMH